MNGEATGRKSSSGGGSSELVILILVLAGLAINLLLLLRYLAVADFGIAGCGGGSSCETVLNSPWSRIFGIPVTVLGLLVYTCLIFSLTPRGCRLLAPLLGAIAGAAVWFIFVQAVLLGKLCPWCMTAHGIGLVILMLGLRRIGKVDGLSSALRQVTAFAIAAFSAVGLSQWYGPRPAMHRIGTSAVSMTPAPAGIHARGDGRKVSFADGTRSYDVTALPHIGSDEAEHVLIEYFDYQCPACRTMRGYLAALIGKHPEDVCVILLPVPLDGGCNRLLGLLDAGHPGSCEYTRLALAVWRSDPAAFAAFHESALKGASLDEARRIAGKSIAPGKLAAALDDPWVRELIAANIADWVSFSGETKKLPKLLITGKRILHGLPSGEADFIRVMEQELGL